MLRYEALLEAASAKRRKRVKATIKPGNQVWGNDSSYRTSTLRERFHFFIHFYLNFLFLFLTLILIFSHFFDATNNASDSVHVKMTQTELTLQARYSPGVSQVADKGRGEGAASCLNRVCLLPPEAACCRFTKNTKKIYINGIRSFECTDRQISSNRKWCTVPLRIVSSNWI